MTSRFFPEKVIIWEAAPATFEMAAAVLLSLAFISIWSQPISSARARAAEVFPTPAGP
ncbi:MAG: hypothetical protein A4E51_01807 [Methanosaeta sp. PtaU1.Bin055]|nr:MAG: hypothetical protein A4E51_01807 [Methanosaeta sp. PtaU1.Bin055]